MGHRGEVRPAPPLDLLHAEHGQLFIVRGVNDADDVQARAAPTIEMRSLNVSRESTIWYCFGRMQKAQSREKIREKEPGLA